MTPTIRVDGRHAFPYPGGSKRSRTTESGRGSDDPDMIEYSPNRDWIRDLKHLGTSWTLRRIVRAVLAVGVYASVLSVVLIRLDIEAHRLVSGAFSLVGVILSIILVFRTNTAYDRWWEGRKLWGSLVNHSRNLAIQIDASFPADDRASRVAFARLIADFAVALSEPPAGRAPTLSALIEPGPARLTAPSRCRATGHLPARIAGEIVARIHAARRDGRDRRIRPARDEAPYPGAARRRRGLRTDPQDSHPLLLQRLHQAVHRPATRRSCRSAWSPSTATSPCRSSCS